jgi:cytochrome bd-type quinol oxidase subunit 2
MAAIAPKAAAALMVEATVAATPTVVWATTPTGAALHMEAATTPMKAAIPTVVITVAAKIPTVETTVVAETPTVETTVMAAVAATVVAVVAAVAAMEQEDVNGGAHAVATAAIGGTLPPIVVVQRRTTAPTTSAPATPLQRVEAKTHTGIWTPAPRIT